MLGAGIGACFRVMRVLLGESIPVTVQPIGLELQAPIGPGGEAVPLQVDTATVTVPRLTGSTFGLEILEQVIRFGTVTTVTLRPVLLARSILRGRVFGRGNTALATTAGITGLEGAGTALALALDGAVGGSVLVELGAGNSDGFVFLVADPALFIIAAFAFAVILTAFTVGARMQRDTEGLV
ncbi:hypothetical protein D1J51_08910 [Leucobacter sp. wl10]|nr:hypothetical protein D1J51_08910 [Leucobacter sp. wl10]